MEKINKTLHHTWPIIIVILIALLLRLWSLATVPPSPSLDEVSIGYNAYSILHTGRDEYGTFLPILLRAYDDWRPALYVYFVVPFVALLGLSTLAVRVPSLVFSLATIVLTYKLIKLLFPKEVAVLSIKISSEYIAITSCFFLAISPWHIYLSRLGHEVNLGLFLTVLASYLFLFGVLKSSQKHFIASAVAFGLGFSSYQSEKVILPILLLSLTALYYRKIIKMKRALFISVVIFSIITFPAVLATLSPEGLTRFQGTSVFNTGNSAEFDSAKEVLKAREEGNTFAEIFYNRRFTSLRIFSAQYLSHFNPQWLFTGSSRESHKVPYLGLLYLFEAPFLVLGIVLFLGFMRVNWRLKIFIFIWFLSSPVPASITTQAPHAMRSFTFLPTLQLFESIGCMFFFLVLPKLLRIPFIMFMIGVVIVSVWHFIIGYFVIFPNTQADSFQLALSEGMRYVHAKQAKYDQVIISNEGNLYQSYMFYLFVAKYDPVQYLRQGGTKSGGFAATHFFDNLEFRPITRDEDKRIPRVLYIGNSEDFNDSEKSIRTFAYPDGVIGIKAVSYD